MTARPINIPITIATVVGECPTSPVGDGLAEGEGPT